MPHWGWTVPRPSNWPKGGQKDRRRSGKTKLSAAKRARIIAQSKARGCWFKYPYICTGLDGKIEIHHVVDDADGGTDDDDNLVAACQPCHTHYSAQRSQQKAVAAAWDWKRKPEKHPGILD